MHHNTPYRDDTHGNPIHRGCLATLFTNIYNILFCQYPFLHAGVCINTDKLYSCTTNNQQNKYVSVQLEINPYQRNWGVIYSLPSCYKWLWNFTILGIKAGGSIK